MTKGILKALKHLIVLDDEETKLVSPTQKAAVAEFHTTLPNCTTAIFQLQFLIISLARLMKQMCSCFCNPAVYTRAS